MKKSFVLQNVLLVLLLLQTSVFARADTPPPSQRLDDAILAFEQGEVNTASVLVRQYLASHPASMPAKVLHGKILLVQLEFSQAQKLFREAYVAKVDANSYFQEWGQALLGTRQYQDIISLPILSSIRTANHPIWQYFHAEACIQLENMSCAKAMLTDIQKHKAVRIDALNALARIGLIEGDGLVAQQYLEQASKDDIDDPETLRLSSLLAKQRGDMQQAEALLKASLALQPDSALALRNLADLYINTQQLHKAHSTTSTLIALSPDDPYAYFAHLWVTEQINANPQTTDSIAKLQSNLSMLSHESQSTEPSLIYLRGLIEFTQGDYAATIQDMSKYLQIAPENLSAIYLLTQAHINNGEDNKALTVLSQRRELINDNYQHLLLLSQLYLMNEALDESREVLIQLQQQYELTADIGLLRFRLNSETAQPDVLIQEITQLFTQFPEHKDTLHMTILTGFANNQLVLVVDALRQLKVVDISDPKIALYDIILAVKLEQFTIALRLINHEITHSGSTFELRYHQGLVLNALQRYDEALPILDNLHGESPEHARTTFELSKALLNTGEVASAERLLSVLVFTYPDELDFQVMYFDQLLQRDANSALAFINKQIKATPTKPHVFILKAKALLTLKDYAGVRQLIQQTARFTQQRQMQILRSDWAMAIGDIELAYEILTQRLASYPADSVTLAKLYAGIEQGFNHNKVLPYIARADADSEEVFFTNLLAQYHFYYGNKATAYELYTSLVNEQVIQVTAAHYLRLAELASQVSPAKQAFHIKTGLAAFPGNASLEAYFSH